MWCDCMCLCGMCEVCPVHVLHMLWVHEVCVCVGYVCMQVVVFVCMWLEAVCVCVWCVSCAIVCGKEEEERSFLFQTQGAAGI